MTTKTTQSGYNAVTKANAKLRSIAKSNLLSAHWTPVTLSTMKKHFDVVGAITPNERAKYLKEILAKDPDGPSYVFLITERAARLMARGENAEVLSNPSIAIPKQGQPGYAVVLSTSTVGNAIFPEHARHATKSAEGIMDNLNKAVLDSEDMGVRVSDEVLHEANRELDYVRADRKAIEKLRKVVPQRRPLSIRRLKGSK